MNLSEQILRNMTTDELLIAAESTASDAMDRMVFEFLTERIQKTLQDSQNELEEKQEEIDELRDQLKEAKEALEKIHKIASEVVEDDDPNYQSMLKALMRVDDIAFEAKEEIVEGLFL
jgi:uncharacterized coiled-coil DUF342 family protein